jgi:D-arabinose 1-dehydrogenase-like Zn-dependent alcohol dehydrogenase
MSTTLTSSRDEPPNRLKQKQSASTSAVHSGSSFRTEDAMNHKGWVAKAAKQPMVRESIDLGPLEAEGVEVAVEHCGLCHSDLSVLNNDWGNSQYPAILGHEVVGRVTAVGPNAKGLQTGQRVGVGWNSGSCMARPTDRVGIIGIGGLGHMAVKFAAAYGCDVTAFTSSESKFEEAQGFRGEPGRLEQRLGGDHRIVLDADF